MRLLAVLLCAACLAACTSDNPTGPSSVDVQLVLAPGESARVDKTTLQLRFRGVLGDSRCPADALCIQGGDALVRVELLPAGGASRTYDLHTGNLEPARHDELTIALENLSPYPFSSRTIAPAEYRATIRVTGAWRP